MHPSLPAGGLPPPPPPPRRPSPPAQPRPVSVYTTTGNPTHWIWRSSGLLTASIRLSACRCSATLKPICTPCAVFFLHSLIAFFSQNTLVVLSYCDPNSCLFFVLYGLGSVWLKGQSTQLLNVQPVKHRDG